MTTEIVATVTSKGQVTIPIEVRQHLGVRPQDKIAFSIDAHGHVHLTSPQYPRIAALRGAAGALPSAASMKHVDDFVEDEHLSDLQHKIIVDRDMS